VDKAHAAIVSAVEIYNKPSFQYREENFAILALNAWELLLKAKLLKDAENDIRVLRVYESRRNKSGKSSTKQYLKRNRAGNPLTKSLHACMLDLSRTPDALPTEVRANLDGLMEIRDNSVHYITPSPVLVKQVQQIASATVANLVHLSKKWFGQDLSNALHLVLPLSFKGVGQDVDAVVVSSDEKRLIAHLKALIATDTDATSECSVAVTYEIRLQKSNAPAASAVQVVRDSAALKVHLTEEDIRARYPWDYRELCKQMSQRYTYFKQDQRFHDQRKLLLSDERFAKSRYLDPKNTKGVKKDFYSPNVFSVFDSVYQVK